jgi:hypothetical protein
VADTAGRHADEDFVVARLGIGDFGKHQRLGVGI